MELNIREKEDLKFLFAALRVEALGMRKKDRKYAEVLLRRLEEYKDL